MWNNKINSVGSAWIQKIPTIPILPSWVGIPALNPQPGDQIGGMSHMIT